MFISGVGVSVTFRCKGASLLVFEQVMKSVAGGSDDNLGLRKSAPNVGDGLSAPLVSSNVDAKEANYIS